MKKIYLFSFLLIICMGISCKKDKSPIGPVPTLPVYTSHEFEWEIDTLDYPGSYQTLIRDIWGTSENNVYAVGHNDQGSKGSIWHWDGNEWKSLVNYEGPIDPFYLGPSSFREIYGFSANDFWIVGERYQENGIVLHFNGNDWIKHDFFYPSNLLSVWGTSSSDLWVGDFYSKIHHYDGAQWTEMAIGVNAGIHSIAGFSENEVYALGYELDDMSPQDSTTYHFFQYSDNTWNKVYSYIVGINPDKYIFGNSALYVINDNTFYSVGYEIFTWHKGNWKNVSFPFYIHNLIDISGSSNYNLFTVGIFGDLFHFNGQDWYQYTELPNISYGSVWMHDRYVFIAGHIYPSNHQTVILRGIQKK